MSFRYSFCGLILWVNFKEIITFETSNTSFKLSFFFFFNETGQKRFIFRFGLQHPGIFLKCNPWAAQNLYSNDHLHNSCFYFVLLCSSSMKNKWLLGIAFSASSLNVECCLFKTRSWVLLSHLLNDFPLSVCVSCVRQGWASSQTHDCLQCLSRQNENIINQYPTTAVFDKFLSDA